MARSPAGTPLPGADLRLDAALAAQPLTELVIPSALDLDQTAPLRGVWTGGGQVLIAGRDAEAGLPVLAVLRVGHGRRVWTGELGRSLLRVDPSAPAAQLAALPGGQALALITDGPLLAVAAMAKTVRPVPQPRPVALLAEPGLTGALAILQSSKSGRITLAHLPEGAHPETTGWDLRQAERRPGPKLAPGQTLSLAVHDAAGRLLLGVDDGTRGFQLLRDEGDRFAPVAVPGAARHGMNAALLTAARWNGVLFLSAGRGTRARAEVPGLLVSGEVLRLDEAAGGDLAILTGELRTGPTRLMVPALPASHPLMLGRIASQLDFTGLCPWEDALVLHLHDARRGTDQLYRLNPDFSGRFLRTALPLAALVTGPEGPIALTWGAQA